jgi:2-polyprenyl-6-methoxyphenol hydroxylase-like FAD-dependent oxidoreductase
VRPGLALAGDAALSADPLYGVGCGWAFQSAEWLADATAASVRGEELVEAGLERYAKQFQRGLLAHNRMIDDYATGRRMNRMERLMFSAIASDRRLAAGFEAFGTRNVDPRRFLPATLPRVLAVHVRRRLRRAASPSQEAPSLQPAA